MKPKLIKTEADYHAALERIDRLMSAVPGTPEADELELWVLLVKTYEDRHVPIAPPTPIEAIRFRLEQQGLRQTDLVPYIGSKSRVSEVLSGRRSLSLVMIRKIHEGLDIPAEILIHKEKPGRARKTRSSLPGHPETLQELFKVMKAGPLGRSATPWRTWKSVPKIKPAWRFS